MKDKKNIKVLVNFSQSDVEILEELKKLTRLNKSEVIRQAVYNYLKNVKG